MKPTLLLAHYKGLGFTEAAFESFLQIPYESDKKQAVEGPVRLTLNKNSGHPVEVYIINCMDVLHDRDEIQLITASWNNDVEKRLSQSVKDYHDYPTATNFAELFSSVVTYAGDWIPGATRCVIDSDGHLSTMLGRPLLLDVLNNTKDYVLMQVRVKEE